MKRNGLAAAGQAWLLIAIFLIAGCAHKISANATFPAKMQWSGRLAIKVQSEPPQSFSADFELGGNPHHGLLVFFTPLGNTAAHLQWAPDTATLTADGKTRQFDSLATLIEQATGAELPVAALFDWLNGKATDAPGWTVDLSKLEQGRLQATRAASPLPAVNLRILLAR